MRDGFEYQAVDMAAKALGCETLIDEPLAGRTTFRIGGPADRLVTAETAEQLSGVLRAIEEAGLPRLILGRGSDLLVGDGGFRGVVVCLGGGFGRMSLLSDGRTIRAGAACSLGGVCCFARDNGLSGLEFAFGIPGSVGGGVYMNAGAYGGELRDVVTWASHYSAGGEYGEYTGEELGFSYRHSRYTDSSHVIAFADFCLSPGDRTQIGEKMKELMARRKAKQPYDSPSGGSAFKRPKTGYASALIESSGLKGRRVGGAQVSEKHAGFIINTGGATCKDVLELMEIVQNEVLKQTGVELEPELRIVGQP